VTAENNEPKRPVVGRPFAKGQTGNPGGRPKVVVEIQALLEEAAPHAAARIIALIKSDDEKIAVTASNSILDRVLGKARESVEVTSDGLSDLLRAIVVAKPPSDEGEKK
jgi:hypothetical protein